MDDDEIKKKAFAAIAEASAKVAESFKIEPKGCHWDKDQFGDDFIHVKGCSCGNQPDGSYLHADKDYEAYVNARRASDPNTLDIYHILAWAQHGRPKK